MGMLLPCPEPLSRRISGLSTDFSGRRRTQSSSCRCRCRSSRIDFNHFNYHHIYNHNHNPPTLQPGVQPPSALTTRILLSIFHSPHHRPLPRRAILPNDSTDWHFLLNHLAVARDFGGRRWPCDQYNTMQSCQHYQSRLFLNSIPSPLRADLKALLDLPVPLPK